mgnify:CR=1 FL=1
MAGRRTSGRNQPGVERVMGMTNRKDHWERVYHEASPTRVSWYQRDPEPSLRLIRETGIARTDALIDVGAGTSMLIDHLVTEDYEALSVLDVSRFALDLARERLGERAAKVEWFEADVIEFVAPHKFMLWHDRAAFHFLTDRRDRRKYVNVMRHALHQGGHAVVATFARNGPKRCSGLDVVQYDSAKLGAEFGDEFQLVSETRDRHVTPANKTQEFGYFHFVVK